MVDNVRFVFVRVSTQENDVKSTGCLMSGREKNGTGREQDRYEERNKRRRIDLKNSCDENVARNDRSIENLTLTSSAMRTEHRNIDFDTSTRPHGKKTKLT